LCSDEGFRVRVAYNSSTPEDTLWHLAKDEDSWVRSDVADNPSTPLTILTYLAKDEDVRVRRFVAKNPNFKGRVRFKKPFKERFPDLGFLSDLYNQE
jgi:hypothetical protein